LLYEAGQLQLPVPLPANGASKTTTADRSPEGIDLAAQLERAKAETLAVTAQAARDKAELLASIHAVQIELSALREEIPVGGRRPSAVGYGKGFITDHLGGGAVASPVHPRGGSGGSGQELNVQTDNLGQMTPQGMSPLTNGTVHSNTAARCVLTCALHIPCLNTCSQARSPKLLSLWGYDFYTDTVP
jgi:hypothetical protein